MVTPERGRYLGGEEGAPPTPPPGGYRGARRVDAGLLQPALAPGALTMPAASAPRPPAGAVTWIAFIGSLLFVLILAVLMIQGPELVWSVTMIVLQLALIGVIIAALASGRGRVLASIALVIAVLFNIGTVGAMSALTVAATHSYDGAKSDAQRHEEAYPGIRGVSKYDVEYQRSLERVEADGDALMAEIRERVTARFGLDWVRSGDPENAPERNGYGGESMLKQYSSARWTTTEPVRDPVRKREIMRIIREVTVEHGMYPLYALSDPGSGISDDMTAKLYGSADPDQQHTWEWYSDDYPDPMRFYALAYDPTKDATGEAQRDRDAMHTMTGEPVEGIQLAIIARRVLSDADRDEYLRRIADYPGF